MLDQCGDELRLGRHSAVIHCGPRRPRCVGRNPTTPTGRGPCHAGPSACTKPGRGVVRRRRERSRRAADPVWNDLLPRRPASSPHHEPLSSCTEEVRSRRTRFRQGPTAAGSVGDIGERPLEAAPPFGQTSVPCACNVARPLQAAIRNVEKISSRDVICTSSAEIPVSVSHHCAERCCKREQHNPRKAASSTTQSWQACRASTNS